MLIGHLMTNLPSLNKTAPLSRRVSSVGRCLPCSHEDLNSDLRTHISKLGVVSHIVIPALVRQQWVDPWDSQPSLLVKLQVREMPCSKKQGRQNLKNSTRGGSFVFYMPVIAHSYAPIHMCVYTHQTRPLILYLQ